jgi:transcriptional regulator with XRE-family HTH domain
MAAQKSTEGPDPVDVHVGARVRMRRKILGMSQEGLGEKLGLTFQQVQKYERGFNRVSSSKLYLAARALGAPISYFFEGLPDPTGDDPELASQGAEQAISAFLLTTEGLELAKLFPVIEDRAVRARLLDLVRSLAQASSDMASKAA